MAEGAEAAFEITPNAYFRIESILTNGALAVSLPGPGPMTYVWSNVVSTGAVHVTFVEQTGSGHGTPFTWLAENGYTNDMDQAELLMGSNGLPLWQSYIAGLNPNDPGARLICQVLPSDGSGFWLRFQTVTGRFYTVCYEDGMAPTNGFALVLTNDIPGTGGLVSLCDSNAGARRCYRFKVRLP